MYIPILPPMRLSGLLGIPREEFPFTCDMQVDASARMSLGQLLKTHDAPEGGKVLMPAYICEEVPAALRQLGYEIRYYRVPRTLECAVDDIDPYVSDETVTLVVTHYFGFPQRNIQAIAEYARARHICLIEDCAHSLTSRLKGKPLGTYGDGGIFSPRKVLGGPGSGISVSSVYQSARRLPIAQEGMTRYICYSLLERLGMSCGVPPERVKRILRPSVYGTMRRRGNVGGQAARQDGWTHTVGEVWLRRWLLSNDLHWVHKARRENYLTMLGELRRNGIRPVYHELGEGICPFVVPIWVDSGSEDIVKELVARGVQAATWPRLPEDIDDSAMMEEVREIRAHIMLLPVHQEIPRDKISCITALINKTLP